MVISRLHLNGKSCTSKKECNWCKIFHIWQAQLNGQHLGQVHSPSFLIMNRNCPHVSGMNQEAFEKLKIKIRGLTQCQVHRHIFSFEEPIKLEEVGRLPVWDCFRGYLLI
jgi:hypothetical protein